MTKTYFLILSFLFTPFFVFAQENSSVEYKITTPIPGISEGSTIDLGSYVASIFQFGLAIVGFVAFGYVVYHGIRYISGAANESVISDAKDGITQVFYGIILLFSSVVILDTINPCILMTVNFWRDQVKLESECQSGLGFIKNIENSGVKVKTLNEFLDEKISKLGVDIITTSDGNSLIITGKKDNNFKRLRINKDSSYQVSYLIENNWEESGTKGDDIYQYDYTSFDGDGVKEKIEKEVVYFLSQSSYSSHDDSPKNLISKSFSAEYNGTPTKEESFTLSHKKDIPGFMKGEEVSFSQEIAGSCQKYPLLANRENIKIDPYYRCSLSARVLMSSQSKNKEIGRMENILININDLPENNNESQMIVEEYLSNIGSELIDSFRKSS